MTVRISNLWLDLLSPRIYLLSNYPFSTLHHFASLKFWFGDSEKLTIRSSVIRQQGESQNRCFKKTKQAKFSEKQTFLTAWYAHVRFEIHPFALLLTKYLTIKIEIEIPLFLYVRPCSDQLRTCWYHVTQKNNNIVCKYLAFFFQNIFVYNMNVKFGH